MEIDFGALIIFHTVSANPIGYTPQIRDVDRGVLYLLICIRFVNFDVIRYGVMCVCVFFWMWGMYVLMCMVCVYVSVWVCVMVLHVGVCCYVQPKQITFKMFTLIFVCLSVALASYTVGPVADMC